MATIVVVPIENEAEKRIEALVSKHPEGLTIADISSKLDLHRHTVSKYVYALVRSSQIDQRKIGKSSLYYPEKVLE